MATGFFISEVCLAGVAPFPVLVPNGAAKWRPTTNQLWATNGTFASVISALAPTEQFIITGYLQCSSAADVSATTSALQSNAVTFQLSQSGGTVKYTLSPQTTAVPDVPWTNPTNSVPICYLLEPCALYPLTPGAATRFQNQEPWTVSTTLNWSISYGSVNIAFSGGTLVEIYAICPNIQGYLAREGIPRALLRFALSFWSGNERYDSLGDFTSSYGAAVTQRVFYSGFVYDRNNGAFAFAGQPSSGVGSAFNLDLFLELWEILNNLTSSNGLSTPDITALYDNLGYPMSPPKMNCYDTAGIVGLLLTFACTSPKLQPQLVYLAPFGFLKNQPLIGWAAQNRTTTPKDIDTCNNPYVDTFWPKPTKKGSSALKVEPTDPNRSRFRNHLFVQWKGQVYDACAGPVTGNLGLAEYINAAIEQDSTKTPPLVYGNDYTVMSFSGTTDFYTWPNNGSRIPSTYPLADNHYNVLGEAQAELRKDQGWKVPLNDTLWDAFKKSGFSIDITSFDTWLKDQNPGGDYQITSVSLPMKATHGFGGDNPIGWVSWTAQITSGGTSYLVKMEWNVYSTPEAAATVRSYEFSGIDSDSDVATITKTALANDKVVSATIGNQNHSIGLLGTHTFHCYSANLPLSVLGDLTQQIMDYANTLDQNKTTIMTVGNASGDPTGSKSYSTFNLQLTASSVAAYAVRTSNVFEYDVTYETGNVCMTDRETLTGDNAWTYPVTDSTDQPSPNVSYFQFRARNVGTDTCTITFYDKYFGTTQRKVLFSVTAA